MTDEKIKTFEIKGHKIRLTKKIPARVFLEAMDPYLPPLKKQEAQSIMLYKMIVDKNEWVDEEYGWNW